MLRFTPTGVGTTRGQKSAWNRTPVHPHGRGDNLITGISKDRLIRFTPTGVGTTKLNRFFVKFMTGSPPRAWGQLKRAVGHRPSSRFTPTGVGTTRYPASAAVRRTVHPHGRGDNRYK